GDSVVEEHIERREALHTTIMKLVNRYGVTSVEDVQSALATQGTVKTVEEIQTAAGALLDHQLLAGHWITSTSFEKRNPLHNRLQKMLSAYPGVPVELACEQLARDPRRGYSVSTEALRHFVRVHPAYELGADDTIHSREPIS